MLTSEWGACHFGFGVQFLLPLLGLVGLSGLGDHKPAWRVAHAKRPPASGADTGYISCHHLITRSDLEPSKAHGAPSRNKGVLTHWHAHPHALCPEQGVWESGRPMWEGRTETLGTCESAQGWDS